MTFADMIAEDVERDAVAWWSGLDAATIAAELRRRDLDTPRRDALERWTARALDAYARGDAEPGRRAAQRAVSIARSIAQGRNDR